jgi:hypothetical protein
MSICYLQIFSFLTFICLRLSKMFSQIVESSLFWSRSRMGNIFSQHFNRSNLEFETNIHKYRRRLKGNCIEHESLYMSLRLCYEYDISEKDLAQNLIHELFICEGNLDTIFSILLPGHVIKTQSAVNRFLHVLYPGFRQRVVYFVHFKRSVQYIRFTVT